jgi:hypothetical protein
VTDEARARIVAEKFSPATNTRSKAAGSANAANRPDHKSPSCIPCLLNNVVDCTARLDSGADDTFMPSILIECLDVNGAPARIQTLPLPLHFLLASKNESVTISRAALVTMQYQTSAGPLLLRNVPSLILADDATEILVGEQLLLDLGFDPQQLLADACVESNDRDCSHVPSAMIHGRGGLMSRVMLQRDAAGAAFPAYPARRCAQSL